MNPMVEFEKESRNKQIQFARENVSFQGYSNGNKSQNIHIESSRQKDTNESYSRNPPNILHSVNTGLETSKWPSVFSNAFFKKQPSSSRIMNRINTKLPTISSKRCRNMAIQNAQPPWVVSGGKNPASCNPPCCDPNQAGSGGFSGPGLAEEKMTTGKGGKSHELFGLKSPLL